MRFRALFALLLILIAPASAQVGEAWYPIKADDGRPAANHRVPVELESEIEKLPGIVTVGNPQGDITLVEFYDLNCPYCRKTAADLRQMVETNKELKLILVPFPVLGVPSILAGRVELAVASMLPAGKFYEFHHKLYAGRGVIDGNRALAVAREFGLDPIKITAVANADATTETMKAHVKLGDALAIAATPGFVIKGTAILGYPGRKAIEGVIASVQRCDKVVC